MNTLQIDEVNELTSRDMSILLPTYFFEKETYRNLHPNFRFHAVIDLLIELQANSQLLLSANKAIEPISLTPRRKLTSNVGILLLDLVDFKRFFNKDNYDNSLNLVKAFQSDITKIIHEYSGYVYKTGGDSFLAVVQKENKKDILTLLLQMALEIQSKPWYTRIGLNWTDQALFEGYIGPLELDEYGIYGADVNIAARLEHKIKEFDNHGILMPAEMTREEVEEILTTYNSNHPTLRFKFEEKCFGGIPEKGGVNQENVYFYITKI